MSLYSFGLEPLSCHTWNKDRTRRWQSNLAAFPYRVTHTVCMYTYCMCRYKCIDITFLYSFSITYGFNVGWDYTWCRYICTDTFSPSSNCINAAWGNAGNLIFNAGNGLKEHLTALQLQDVCCSFCTWHYSYCWTLQCIVTDLFYTLYIRPYYISSRNDTRITAAAKFVFLWNSSVKTKALYNILISVTLMDFGTWQGVSTRVYS